MRPQAPRGQIPVLSYLPFIPSGPGRCPDCSEHLVTWICSLQSCVWRGCKGGGGVGLKVGLQFPEDRFHEGSRKDI